MGVRVTTELCLQIMQTLLRLTRYFMKKEHLTIWLSNPNITLAEFMTYSQKPWATWLLSTIKMMQEDEPWYDFRLKPCDTWMLK